jgi:tRNA1Val (adenine37-N6)-methyltransferase
MPKSGTHFHFKQFSICHARSSMKVGTDGVLLGAWARVGSSHRILDIGTGSGVIALMLAQRTEHDAMIDAVEIDSDDAAQATENVVTSPWPQKIIVHNKAVQEFIPPYKYDLIISNPPYFNNSQKPPAERRTQTRHTTTLSFEMLLKAVDILLSEHGKFNVILPYQEGLEFLHLASVANLYCTRKYSFRTRAEKPIERWLLEFSRENIIQELGEILLYNDNLTWSHDYSKLTSDFYLKI